MTKKDSYFYSTVTAAEVDKRIKALFEGLNVEEGRNLFEELLDYYTSAVYNVEVVGELRKLQFRSEGTTSCTQVIAAGRGILLSSYGFTVKEEINTNGLSTITLVEISEEEFYKRKGD